MEALHRTAVLWMLATSLACSCNALASDQATTASPAEPAVAPVQVTTTPGVAADEADLDVDLGDAVSDESLAAARGREDLHLNENVLEATLEGNVATNLSTGNNSISEGAFSNTSGIPMVIQNSGNNVIIQNSTILNLQLQ